MINNELAASLRILNFEVCEVPLDPSRPALGSKAVEYVNYTSVGQGKYTVVHDRIVDVQRRTDGMWQIVEPHYEAWKKGNELPDTGTPLLVWNGVLPSQRDVLKTHGIRTVEELAMVPDSLIDRIGLPGLRTARDAARKWEEGRDMRDVNKSLAEKDAEIEALKDQMADLMAMLKGDPNEEPVKRRPGRPRKDEAEAA